MDINNLHLSSESEQHLISFLDGELSLEKEQELFSQLAVNDNDIRSSMRELLAIRNAVQNDIEAFTPPTESKDIIFSSIGINLPKVAELPVLTHSNVWKRYIIPLALLFIGIGSGIAFTFDKYAKDRNEIVSLMNSAKNYASTSQVAISSGESAQVPNIILQQPTKIVYRDRIVKPEPIEKKIDISSVLSTPNEIATHVTITEIPQTILDKEVVTLPLTNESKMIEEVAKTVAPSQITNQTIIEYPLFWTQIRGLTTVNGNEYSGIQPTASITDNVKLAFAYSLSDNLAVGFETGRELYALQYQGIKDNRSVDFYQLSPMLSGGLFIQARTNPQEIVAKGSQLYLSGFAGGTEVGLLGRIGTGIIYPITPQFAVNIGCEQSWMNYQYQGNWFQTQKLDILYGITITF
jgi:hypothetical protein